MDTVEKWGDDVESAVKLALDDLKATADEVDVEILEQPSRGFFGIGSKLAKVRVTKKAAVQEQPAPREEEAAEEMAAEETAQAVSAPERVEKHEAEESHPPRASYQGGRERNDHSRGKKKRGPKNHPNHRRSAREDVDDVFTLDDVEVNFRSAMKELPVVEDHPALTFLKDVVSEMGLNVDMTAHANEQEVLVEMFGDDCRTIIGKRGQTLDSLQYLTSIVVNRGQKDYIRVVIDAENYRSRRERTLEKLALRLAKKAVDTGRSVKLEPMNPYERKVIHSTLQNHPLVTTRSEGEDPYRRVVIELK